MSFGGKIRDLRLMRGLSQAELAEGFISPGYIGQIEQDRTIPSVETIVELAVRLNVTIHDLVQGLSLSSNEWKRLINLLVVKKECESAIPVLQYLSEQEPLTFEWRLLLASCYNETKREIEMISLLDKMLFETGNLNTPNLKFKVLSLLASAYFQLKNFSLAQHFYKKAMDLIIKYPDVENDPKLKGRVFNRLGIMSMNQGNYNEAISYYEEALSFLHDNQEVSAALKVNIGICLKDLKKFEQAVGKFNEVLSILPSNHFYHIEALYHLAMAYTDLQQYDEAIRNFSQCKKLYIKHRHEDQVVYVYSKLAHLELKRGNILHAKNYAQKVLKTTDKTHQERAKAYVVLSEIMNHLNLEEAISYLEKAISIFRKLGLYVEYNKVLLKLAALYKDGGDAGKARATLELIWIGGETH
jgi:tetratricopeptide (TPR) repeat protein